jgi:hypothetical protein
VCRQAAGPEGTLYLADLRIVSEAPSQRPGLAPGEVERFTPMAPKSGDLSSAPKSGDFGYGPLPVRPGPVLLGTTKTGREWATAAPFIYIINYEEKMTPDYVARIAANSADLFHAGNNAPFKPYWGPSRDHSFAESPLIGPEEVRRQIADLKAFVAAMKASGIDRVISSSCSITIGGSPKKRLGMWAFYDRWNDYLSFGLPPKPAHDPLDWNQKDASGQNRYLYGQPYTTWTNVNPDFDRYCPCPSNPEWLEYSRFVTRMIAECGFDGVFIDNNTLEGCCCESCRSAFRKWLTARDLTHTPTHPHTHTPTLPDLTEVAKGPPLLQEQAADFYADQIRHFLTECQAAGEAVRSKARNEVECHEEAPFFLCLNWTGASANWSRDHVWTRIPNAWPMRELDLPLGEGEPDAFGQQPGYYGTLLWYKADARLHTPRAGRTVMLNYQTNSANWAELAQAESAAFGEGAVHCALADGPAMESVYARYRQFYRQRKGLFAGLESYAQLGVPYFRSGMASALSVGRLLLDAHVPFDFIDSRDFTVENLRHFQALLCNNVLRVSGNELGVLENFLRGGGRVIVTGRFAVEDERGQPRRRGPVYDLIKRSQARPFRGSVGRGVLVYTPLALAPRTAPVLDRLLNLVGVQPMVAGTPRPGLRVNAYANRRHMVVHLVNFRVPKEGEPIAQENLELRVPLPGQWKGRRLQATWHEPGAESKPLTEGEREKRGDGRGMGREPGAESKPLRFAVSGSEARVVVEQVRVYGAVEIGPTARL